MYSDILRKLQEKSIEPKMLYSVAHKQENNRGTWWYSLQTGEWRVSKGKHSDKEFEDIAYKPGWIRGRVFEFGGENWLIVYFVKNITGGQLLDLKDKLENELDLEIKNIINKDGEDMSDLIEDLKT